MANKVQTLEINAKDVRVDRPLRWVVDWVAVNTLPAVIARVTVKPVGEVLDRVVGVGAAPH